MIHWLYFSSWNDSCLSLVSFCVYAYFICTPCVIVVFSISLPLHISGFSRSYPYENRFVQKKGKLCGNLQLFHVDVSFLAPILRLKMIFTGNGHLHGYGFWEITFSQMNLQKNHFSERKSQMSVLVIFACQVFSDSVFLSELE